MRRRRYTAGKTFPQFKKNDLLLDGVIRNLEIIGEASKKLNEHHDITPKKQIDRKLSCVSAPVEFHELIETHVIG